MHHAYLRSVVFVALGAFVPLFYYLAVVGGLLPYGAILLIAIRNLGNGSILLFSLVHLVVYGVLLYWLAGLVVRLLVRVAGSHVSTAIVIVVVLLAGVGMAPMFGVAHGQIQWVNAYALYASDSLR
ncbi:MAG: hypothetical protein WC538_12615 [Thermoanaerobaculia bacterium]|jgi:hypothetical protein